MRQFCTVVTRSHVFYAKSLSESLRASGNPEVLHVLVADASQAELPADSSAIAFIGFDKVEGGLPPLIRYYYDPFELSNALKPYLITLLFDRYGAAKVIYLDSDLLVTGSFARFWDGFGNASLLLSPHQYTPPPMGFQLTSEVDIVDMGILNGGFAAWREGPAARSMLEWMRTRFVVYGFCDRPRGMFVDQKLLPLLLEYYPDDVAVVRDRGINVAFWNAYERAVERSPDGTWKVGGVDVVFFHLSGYRLSRPGVPCTYLNEEMNGNILKSAPWMKEVLAQYHATLEHHEAPGSGAKYAFASYKGVALTQEYRRLIFTSGGLDRGSYAFWRIWVREHLRLVKRLIVRLGGSR